MLWNKENGLNCAVSPDCGNDKVVTVEINGAFLIFPAYMLAQVADVITRAAMYKPDNYPNHEQLIPVDLPLTFKLEDGKRFAPADPRVTELNAKLTQKNADWYNQYVKVGELEKKLEKATAVIEALQQKNGCKIDNMIVTAGVAGVGAGSDS